MDPRDLELAAEFCTIVGASDLLAYLGMEPDADGPAAQATLKARRLFMQGMQGNPKYKREALFLIRHFSALSAALQDVPAYLGDARRRSESVHLPVLEMTIRGVLSAGPLTQEQMDYLRRNAAALGVSDATFERLLAQAARELGTAPEPVSRSILRIAGPTQRSLQLRPSADGIALATLEIHNDGDGPMRGALSADVPWIAVDPKRLDPDSRIQRISVQVDPSDVPSDATAATISVQTDDGDTTRVVFELQRETGSLTIPVVIGTLITVIVVGALVLAAL